MNVYKRIYVCCSAKRQKFIAGVSHAVFRPVDYMGHTTDMRYARLFVDIADAKQFLEGRKGWRVIEVGSLHTGVDHNGKLL